MNREIKRGYWKHFKGNTYRVDGVFIHTETGEEMVVYQDLKFNKWVRPKVMFLEEVPTDKENPTGQKYRFEFKSEFGKVCLD